MPHQRLRAALQPRRPVGRSLAPLLTSSPPLTWRTAFLVEHRSSPEEYGYVKAIPEYYAVRTDRYSYVEYPTTGETELYDLNADPTELTSLHASASHQALISELKARLAQLKQCKGTGATQPSCEAAEGR